MQREAFREGAAKKKQKTDCFILREDGMEFGNYFMQTNTIKLTLGGKYIIIHFQSEVKSKILSRYLT